MGVGENFLAFNHHHHQMMKKDDQKMNMPKGCVAVMVGHEGEEQRRFVIPLMYLNHPLFMELLKEAEEEYGFQIQGPITIPCDIQDFCNVQELIDQDQEQDRHHHYHICCFRY